ncbi:tRNA lysidine(34) synthetase TilS [Virgibacillus sp. 179-BFC.A HS]|uniref:tRNA(Ile)-lysidine synthase n=1 Tax=Tigheibacillus jepli TaxID=3035914 RepID=A0ABU5CCN6_9BACI|nr:tRNA lysidine(34) synthetase TilS [Virgibacillus sp. 179-BFC.A HS]MDY0404026.1 tRNA lysidine(34) synthetase TilS [Virgibacillus sp. 179-BFC.A HS]
MEQEVTAFIQKKHLLTKGATVMVGVSGGPDSMALLHYLCEKRATWDLHLIAVSVDHQLRGQQSREDVLYVEKMCKAWDVDFAGGAVDVKAYKKRTHAGTQQACRILRYQFFEEQMKTYQADYLALAHHGDDQVETLLMRLTRVADAQQFSGIPLTRPFAGGMIIRPFLCVTRQQIDAYLAKHGIVPRLDPSNLETDYTRNYFRKYVVPLLRNKNTNIHHTQQHLSETLHEDEVFLREEARKMAKKVITCNQNSHTVSFEITAFQSYPTALQRRVYHLILNYLYQSLPKNLHICMKRIFLRCSTVQMELPVLIFPMGLR